MVLEAGVDREVCPLNLAPTASTAVAMAIGDALAAVWMERRGISPADFALNHPVGSLGKQLTLTAADLMVPTSQLHPLQPHTPLLEVIGGLTRDGMGSGWVENPDSPGGCSESSRMGICVERCTITVLTPGRASPQRIS